MNMIEKLNKNSINVSTLLRVKFSDHVKIMEYSKHKCNSEEVQHVKQGRLELHVKQNNVFL